MQHLLAPLSSFSADESGQDLIEYALVACFIGLGAVLSMKSVATAIGGVFSTLGADITGAI